MSSRITGGEPSASGTTSTANLETWYPSVIPSSICSISGTDNSQLSGKAPVPLERLLLNHPAYNVKGTRLIQSTLTVENLRHYLNTFQPEMAKPEWEQDMLKDNTLTVWLRLVAAWETKSANLPIMVEILGHSAEAEMFQGNQLTNGAEWLMERILATSMQDWEVLRPTYKRACEKQFSQDLADDQLLAMTADFGGGPPAHTNGETVPARSANSAFSSRAANGTNMLETPNQTTIGSGSPSNEAAR